MKSANSDVMMAGAGGPRKKCRRSSQSSDDKKPRGRPRVEPQDETAADRRRTQIRLAQRAYRLRKETTIMTLRQRNLELTDVINNMFAALGALSEKAVAGGIESLSASIFADLHDTERVFGQLKERAMANGCDDLEMPEKLPKADGMETLLDSPPESQSPEQSRGISSSSRAALSSPTIVGAEERRVPSVWGYESIHNTRMAVSPQDFGVSIGVAAHGAAVDGTFWDQVSKPLHMDANMDPFRASGPGRIVDAPTLPVAHYVAQSGLGVNLCAPASFAWQEASFARQLHRATLEAGVMLIQRQILSPHRFNRKFQLCLPFGSRESILDKITDTLRREPSQPLDWHDHPIRHLGGAGMHYATRKDSRNDSPSGDDAPVTGPLGASMLAELMNSTGQGGHDGQIVDTHGFEGEWFDAQDVEGYLEHRGVHIEPGNFTAMFEPSICVGHRRTSSPGCSLDGLDISSLGNDKLDRDQPWLSSKQHARGQAHQMQQPKAVIDVPRLMQEIIKRSTCLGRTPGYRRRDVDRAIQTSLCTAA